MTERLDRFMARANAAYYAARDPFSDFTTAPEITQIFGELLGLWAALVWQMLGSPHRVVFAEAGPGRGHLMHDALRAAGRAMPAFVDAASIHLVETSPRLIGLLRERLPSATIHADVATLPEGPLILLANEFLDALPIRQFIRRGGMWHERYVADGRFIEQKVETDLPGGPDGTIRERSDEADSFVSSLSNRITKQRGAALLIDYGYLTDGPANTLQAIADGKPADPLTATGQADLTGHVNFGRIAEIAGHSGTTVHGPITQGAFLAAIGIHERTAQLGRQAGADEAVQLVSAVRRLTAPEAMGSLFKVLGLSSTDLPLLPGFRA